MRILAHGPLGAQSGIEIPGGNLEQRDQRDASAAGSKGVPEPVPGKSVEREPDSIAAVPPTADASQQPGFKVVDEAPSRGGRKLVWTALIVVVAILAGYYFGYFR